MERDRPRGRRSIFPYKREYKEGDQKKRGKRKLNAGGRIGEGEDLPVSPRSAMRICGRKVWRGNSTTEAAGLKKRDGGKRIPGERSSSISLGKVSREKTRHQSLAKTEGEKKREVPGRETRAGAMRICAACLGGGIQGKYQNRGGSKKTGAGRSDQSINKKGVGEAEQRPWKPELFPRCHKDERESRGREEEKKGLGPSEEMSFPMR